MTEYKFYYEKHKYLSLCDGKECIIGNDYTKEVVKGEDVFAYFSLMVRCTYKKYVSSRHTCSIEDKQFDTLYFRRAFLAVILRSEFPSVKCNDIYHHILECDYKEYEFDSELNALFDPPECYNHKKYMRKIKTLLSDIDVDFINGSYKIKPPVPLPKDLVNIVYCYYGNFVK